MSWSELKLGRRLFYWLILPLILFYAVTSFFKPQDKLLAQLNSRLKEQAGMEIGYSEAKISPFGDISLYQLTLDQVEDQYQEIDGQKFILPKRRYFTGDVLKISVFWKELFQKQAGLKFRGNAYAGDFRGNLSRPIQTDLTPFDLNLQWTDIDMKALSIDFPRMMLNQGSCTGNVQFTVDPSRVFKYSGPGNLTISDTVLTPPDNLEAGIDLPVFNEITGKLNFNYEEIHLNEVWVYSESLSALVTGLVYMKLPTRNTWLNLKAKIYFADKKSLNPENFLLVTIEGPAKDPTVKTMGMDLRKLKDLW